MADYMVRNVLIIVILCVAVIFISGIALPRLFSQQYFELRSELNAQSNILELQSNVLTGINEGLGNASIDYIPSNENISSVTNNDFSREQQSSKSSKRKKRETYNHKRNHFTWHFNLNVTKYDNSTHPDLQGSKHDSQHSSKTENYVEMAVFVKGNGPNRNNKELENAWSSVGNLIKNFFGESSDDLVSQLEEAKLNKAVYLMNDSLQNGSHSEATINPDIGEFDAGSGEEPTNLNRREGRFIFNLFGFGGKSLSKTTQFPEKNSLKTTDPSLLFHDTQTDPNIFRNEKDSSEIKIETSEVVTEKMETLSIEDSLMHNVLDFSATNSSVDLNQSSHNTENDECMGCNVDGFGLATITNKGNDINQVINALSRPTESSFTDDQLNKFCMNLVNQLAETQRLFSNDISLFEQDKKDAQSNSSEEHQYDSPDALNTLEESVTETDIIEDLFFVSNESSTSKITESTTHKGEKRFINLLGFGSGRSALNEIAINDMTLDEQSSVVTEMESMPSALDCESYFRKKQNLKFPKPNLMDMISDPNIKLTDFANATISPKLQEQQLQFLTDLLKSILSNSSEKSNENSGNVITDNVQNGDSISLQEKNSFSVHEFETNVKESLTTNPTTISNFEGSLKSDSNTEVGTTTENQREGRFFNLFGFGSSGGGGISQPESSEGKDGRFFIGSLGNIFGSGGGRALETSDTFEEFEMNVIGSGDSFQDVGLFSGDGKIFDETENSSEMFDETTIGQERFLGIFGFGSGGRQFSDVELIQTEAVSTEQDICGNECSFEIYNTTEESLDCTNNGCGIENPHDHTFSTELNMSCPNDCQNISNSFDETPSEFESCGDCSHKHDFPDKDALTENSTFDECDDCQPISLSQKGNDYDEKIISNETEYASFPRTNNSNYDNQCGDCDFESDFYDEELKPKIDISKISLDDGKSNDTKLADNFTKTQDLGEIERTDKDGRIFGTIFLTGSGDGGLFEDAGGPINLVEEDTIKPSNLSLRSKLNEDVLNARDSVNVSVTATTIYVKSTINPQNKFARRGKISDETGQNITPLTNTISERTIKPLKQFPTRRGRVMDIDNVILNEKTSDEQASVLHNVSSTHGGNKFAEAPAAETSSITFYPELKSTSGNVFREPQPKFCTSASDCNAALNEKCVPKNASLVCDCQRTMVRNKETGKCVVKVVLETSIKLPEEEFSEDLLNAESQSFKKMRENATKVVWMLLEETNELIPIVIEVDITGFRPGSLIVDSKIILAVEEESEAKLVEDLENYLKKALQGESLQTKTPLNIRQASLISANTVNSCMSPESNYCSENAYCTQYKGSSGRYTCHCREGYFDASSNKMYPGEVCEAICSSDYCGGHGHCEIFENQDRRCVCFGWYFGDRCEISGVVVIATFSANLFLIIVMIFLFIIWREKRRRRSRTQFRSSAGIETQSRVPGRVSDVIALEENIAPKTSKFVQISTPVSTAPVITVTHPSLVDSDISNNWLTNDSTFDITPSSGEMEANV